MRDSLRVGTALAAAFTAAASASAPAAHHVQAESTVTASVDDAWSAVIDIFGERNWTIQTTDKASGLIATDWLTLDLSGQDEKYADCGSAPLATDVAAGVRFNIRVKPDGGSGSVVRVNAVFRKIRTFDRQERTIGCNSRGVLERELQDEVAERVASHRGHEAKTDEPGVVTGDRSLFCTVNGAEGACFLKLDACNAEHAKLGEGFGECEEREAGACFNANVALDGKRTTTCAPNMKSCEAKRGQIGSDPDFTNVSKKCGVYRKKTVDEPAP